MTEDVLRLLARLEQQADSDVMDATTRHSHGNRKALTKEQAKKIAMGHKADDHEEGQKNELSDFPSTLEISSAGGIFSRTLQK